MRGILNFITAFIFTAGIFIQSNPAKAGVFDEKEKIPFGWQKDSSPHFIVYFDSSIPKTYVRKVIRRAESLYDTETKALGFIRFDFWLWENRAKIFIYNTREDYVKNRVVPEWSGASVDVKEKKKREQESKMKRFIGVLVALVFVVGFSVGGARAQEAIKIGTSMSLTGHYSGVAREMIVGYNLAFRELNESGGVHGKKITQIVYDDGYNPQNTVKNLSKLINKDKVNLLFAIFGTPPNAIVFGSGWITIPKMVKAGIVVDLIGVVIITAVMYALALYVFGITFGSLPVWATLPG